MHITILHNAVNPDAGPDEQDVLIQLHAVKESLRRLGHDVNEIACTLNLEALSQRLLHQRPDLVFNLVEGLGGTDRLLPTVPALLEHLSIPYTGNRWEALCLTNDKTLCKQRLLQLGLPTPIWMDQAGEIHGDLRWNDSPEPKPFLIKTVSEHASWGLDDDAVVHVHDAKELHRLLLERSTKWKKMCLAEAFIAGREFNLSVLAGDNGPEVLPCAEIDFAEFPAGKPRIVGYRAKWDESSFEAVHTPRTFRFAVEDAPLLEELQQLARRCWKECGLDGYARIDFRVDEQNQPWILEVNANPCLSPDAGFAAALAQAGISFDSAIERIVSATKVYVRLNVRSSATSTSSASRSSAVTLRTEMNPGDRIRVREIVESTGFFTSAEVDVAVELVDERLLKGDASGYYFIFAEQEGVTVGYTCYGPIACTIHSFDLYWIAVDQKYQGLGIGRELLTVSEKQICDAGGSRIYVETSSKPEYHSTRTFYEHTGYILEATVIDFYAPKDDKMIYVKVLHNSHD
ncbi:MAG: GNAT family N-acetyltransferase [Planctomycetaceae bacterium]